VAEADDLAASSLPSSINDEEGVLLPVSMRWIGQMVDCPADCDGTL